MSVQFLEDKKKDIVVEQTLEDLFSIFSPSIDFFAFSFSTFCIVLLIATLFKRIAYNCKSNNFIHTLLELLTKSVNADSFGCFFICFIIFNFIILQIISNNVKTSKLIVDTSSLITSENQLRNTKKELCLLEEGQEADYFKYSPANTLRNFAYRNLMNPTNPCYIIEGQKLRKIADYSKFFTLILADAVKIKIKFIENFFNCNSFVNQRRKMPRKMKEFLDQCVYVLMEQSFINWLFEEAEVFNAKNDNGIYKTFFKLSTYIEENSLISNLSFENLEATFNLFFIFNICLITLFVSYQFCTFLIKFIHVKSFSFFLHYKL